MPDLPDTNVCDHEFEFWDLYEQDVPEYKEWGMFFCIFVCRKCGEIKRVWEKLDGN